VIQATRSKRAALCACRRCVANQTRTLNAALSAARIESKTTARTSDCPQSAWPYRLSFVTLDYGVPVTDRQGELIELGTQRSLRDSRFLAPAMRAERRQCSYEFLAFVPAQALIEIGLGLTSGLTCTLCTSKRRFERRSSVHHVIKTFPIYLGHYSRILASFSLAVTSVC